MIELDELGRVLYLISWWLANIKCHKAIGFLDINKVAENVALKLLNEIYDYKLVNLNDDQNDYPGIDLGDKDKKIAFQITSKKSTRKIKKDLGTFVKESLNDYSNGIRFLILTQGKKPQLSKDTLTDICRDFDFDPDQHILIASDLIKEIQKIYKTDKKKFYNIKEILEMEIAGKAMEKEIKKVAFSDAGTENKKGDSQESHINNVNDDQKPKKDSSDWLNSINRKLRKDLYNMDIERKELMQNLERFVMDGNGVIVGRPGVGKSFSLSRLKILLKNKNIPYLSLPIDQLGSGTIEELQSILSFKGDIYDLISKLQDEVSQLKKKPGILLIDAFDAARNEEIRCQFLNMIRLFVLELRGWWNVIVAVRTYDALKSQELLELFYEQKNEDNRDYFDPDIECRNFRLPPLNENEINQAIEQIPNLSKMVEQASSDFKKLLEIPFNIWLIEKILDDSRELPDINHVKSEVQLLDLFWEKRVSAGYEGDSRESILRRLAERMIVAHSLSIRKKDVHKINENKFWTELYSNEVLIKVSSTKQRVSFSHNILFDYAVSKLVIDDDSKELIKFILKDPSYPVFLRPNFDFYFTRLWHDEPLTFWKIFCDIYLNENKDLRLSTRLLPPTVIVREARTNDELEPLLDFLKQSNDFSYDAVCHILQAHNALQVKRDLLWIKFLREASKYLQKQFAWDMIKLSSNILERAIEDNNDEIFTICGEVSRTILIWILEKRKINDCRDWVDRLGALWVVPLVAKTFKTNIAESSKLLERVLSIANEKNKVDPFVKTKNKKS